MLTMMGFVFGFENRTSMTVLICDIYDRDRPEAEGVL